MAYTENTIYLLLLSRGVLFVTPSHRGQEFSAGRRDTGTERVMNMWTYLPCAQRRHLWEEHREAVRELIACADAKAAAENAQTLEAYAAASQRCQVLRRRAQEHEEEHGCGTRRFVLDASA